MQQARGNLQGDLLQIPGKAPAEVGWSPGGLLPGAGQGGRAPSSRLLKEPSSPAQPLGSAFASQVASAYFLNIP